MEDLFKMMLEPGAADKEVLGQKSSAYFERMLQISEICRNFAAIDKKVGDKMLEIYLPIIETLTAYVNKSVEDYQEKHGEL